jgi:Skp family chaperone for outer membrane proteins
LVRNEIGERCKLASDAPQYAQALGEWRAFAGDRKVSDENRQKAQTEIAALQAKAKDDAARLRGRAEAMARENKKAEAIDELKSQRPRFKDTAGAEEIEAIIRDLEK